MRRISVRNSSSASRKAGHRGRARAGDGHGARPLPPDSSPRRRDHPVPPPARRARWAGSWKSSSAGREAAEDRKVTLTLDARARLARRQGWDPAYGARPLKRVIQPPCAGSAGRDDPRRRCRRRRPRYHSAEGNVLTFNARRPQTAEIAQFETPAPKRKRTDAFSALSAMRRGLVALNAPHCVAFSSAAVVGNRAPLVCVWLSVARARRSTR